MRKIDCIEENWPQVYFNVNASVIVIRRVEKMIKNSTALLKNKNFIVGPIKVL